MVTISFRPHLRRNAASPRSQLLHVYPSLRRALIGAWIPSLGMQGTLLFDLSGYAHHGILTNMDPATDWIVSQHAYVLNFDGTNNRVDLGDIDAPFIQTNKVTYVVRINRTVNTAAGIIATSGFDHGLTYESNAVWFYTRASGNPTNWNWGTGVTLPLGTWTHVAATYDGITKRLYVNGVQQASVAFTGTMSDTANSFSIGSVGTGTFLNGKVSDVRMYRRALTPQEVVLDSQRLLAPFMLRPRRVWMEVGVGEPVLQSSSSPWPQRGQFAPLLAH